MVDELFTAILKRAEGWSDVCVLFLIALGGSLWANRAQWRRAEEAKKALRESQAAHEADLRKQIELSEAHGEYFRRHAAGFQAGASILRPFADKETPPK